MLIMEVLLLGMHPRAVLGVEDELHVDVDDVKKADVLVDVAVVVAFLRPLVFLVLFPHILSCSSPIIEEPTFFILLMVHQTLENEKGGAGGSSALSFLELVLEVEPEAAVPEIVLHATCII